MLLCGMLQVFDTEARGLLTHYQRSEYYRSVLAVIHAPDVDVDDHNVEEKCGEEDLTFVEEQENRSPSKREDVEEFEDKNESEEEEEEYEEESEEEEEEDDAQDEVVDEAPLSESANIESSVENSKEHPSESPTPINQTLLQYYKAMIDQNTDHHGSERFDANEKIQVELLVILKKTKAPLEAFETILNWAAKAAAADYRFVKPVPQRKKLLVSIFQNLGMNDFKPKEKEMKLPYCGQKVNTVFPRC